MITVGCPTPAASPICAHAPPTRDRVEALGDHAGGEREAHHLGEQGGVLGGGKAGQHAPPGAPGVRRPCRRATRA